MSEKIGRQTAIKLLQACRINTSSADQLVLSETFPKDTPGELIEVHIAQTFSQMGSSESAITSLTLNRSANALFEDEIRYSWTFNRARIEEIAGVSWDQAQALKTGTVVSTGRGR